MPAKRRCPGTPDQPCPRLIPAGTRYCPDHARAYEQRRGTTTARGYGQAHQATRTRWAARVATGQVACTRCGQVIQPTQPWDLGHSDDRSRWTGPECASCNRAAGGRAAH